MTRLVIRADASAQIGTGHVMRCLALAQAWQAAGGRTAFLTCSEDEAIRERIRQAGCELLVARQEPAPADSKATIGVCQGQQADWLVVDGYHFDSVFQQAVRSAGIRLLVIDDYMHLREYHADLLLNQNISAAALRYHADPDTRFLLGPRFALLRPEFQPFSGWTRSIPSIANRLLVTLGGADAENVTGKVLEAIQQLSLPELEVKVVVGGVNPNFLQLSAAVERMGPTVQLLRDVSRMSDLMTWADMALTAGGSTCWELAFLGLPFAVITQAANQADIAVGLAGAGVARHLGWHDRITSSDIAAAIRNLRNDQAGRSIMSGKGRALIDGKGPVRVVRVLRGESE